jgi:hypothetical protein
MYLWSVGDHSGQTNNFLPSAKWGVEAAKRFLRTGCSGSRTHIGKLK